MPEHADRALALQRAIVRVIRGARPDRLRAIREKSGTSLDAAAARCVGQVALRQRIGGDTLHSPRSPPLPTAGARPCTCVLGNRRFGPSDRGEESYGITESGRAELVRWANEFRSWLTAELSDWNMDGDEQLGAELTELAPQTGRRRTGTPGGGAAVAATIPAPTCSQLFVRSGRNGSPVIASGIVSAAS